ncbi:MAG: hypothetical protein IJW30_00185 [Clostridia bacterium]|nr:hypothetical protein [Clostridia bacterium]
MLGYVRAQAPELRIRDYDCYRALYCGLCHHMGKCTGQCSRMALSYDFVFLALIRISLSGEELHFKKKRCIAHPFKKRNTVEKSETLRYCADATAILTYHKCRDDVTDEKGFKRLRARLASLFFRGGYRRAKRRHPALDTTVRERLAALRRYELDKDAPPSADAPAEIFGALMEAIFSEGLEGADARIAANIGRAVGHWIYLIDAADDFLKDRKSGSFNPYLRLFGNAPEERDWQTVGIALKRLLTDAERAFLLIDRHPTPELNELLCNILYLGLPETADKILKQTAKGEQKDE